jgi:hypothetical protein
MKSTMKSCLWIFNTADQFFFHPDYTVGFGISPNQSPGQKPGGVADYTAGREFHPALKNFSVNILPGINPPGGAKISI